MKRWLPALAGLVLLGSSVVAWADPGHDRPKITKFEFAQPALHSGIDETLLVDAHDPNSWIHEVQAQWEDEDHNGGLLYADTFCVQDRDYSDPGTPAKLKIPVFFDHPGRYHLEVRALSALKCQPGNHEQTSRTLEMDVVVRDPLKEFSDPDDTSGPLDITSMAQTQQTSETSAPTEIVHRFTMSDPWTNDRLAGSAFVELYFDLDGDASTAERILTIDLDESDGTLRASMSDPKTGQGRGYAAVSRPDDHTIAVRFPPLLVKKGLSDYRWYVSVDGGSSEGCVPESPCIDRAPDDGVIRHRL